MTDANSPSKFGFRRILRWSLIGLAGVFVVAGVPSCGYGPLRWYVNSVDFSPDGKTLAVGVYRWQRAPWELDPKFLISGIEQTVKLLDLSTGDELVTLVHESYAGIRGGLSPQPRSWGKFSPDGTMLAIGHWDGTVNLWSIRERTARPIESWGYSPVRCVEFSPTGESLIIGYRHNAEAWNVKDPEKPTLITDRNDENNTFNYLGSLHSLSYSPDGKTIAYGDTFRGGAAILKADTGELLQQFQWNRVTGKRPELSDGNSDFETCEYVIFSPDGKTLAVGGAKRGKGKKSVKLVDVETGKEIARYDDRYGIVNFSPDGDILAIAGYKGLTLIDMTTKQIRIDKPRRGIRDLVFSPDSKMMALGDWNGNVVLLNTESGNVIWETDVVGFQKYSQLAKWGVALLLVLAAYLLKLRGRGDARKTPH